MKRLFELIGLTYLSVLAIVFYFYSLALLNVLMAVSITVIIVCGVMLLLKKHKQICKRCFIVAVTSACACCSMCLFTNIFYLQPVNNYSNKEINITGYIYDEVIKNENSCIYKIKTYTVNNNDEKINIQFTSYKDFHIEPFDKINAKLFVYNTQSNKLKSQNIFLVSNLNKNTIFNKTGEKQFSLLSNAVSLRVEMKKSFDRLLPEEYSSLCKAVLLGDKNSMSNELRKSFSDTGTTFFIVVSGMHFVIVVSLCLFLIRKFTRNKAIILTLMIFIITFFMVLTGFSNSVLRAGIMMIIASISSYFRRMPDSMNSLGIAGICLTIFNPYSVGDLGLLMSFFATAGIIKWGPALKRYFLSIVKFKHKCTMKVYSYFANILATSLSASIWILPVSIVCLHRVSPLVVAVSVIITPFISCLLVTSLFASLLYLIPFVSFLAYPFALLCGFICKASVFIINFFAKIPLSSLNADKVYFYIWIAITILCVIIGFAVKRSKKYIKQFIAVSIVTLLSGYVIFNIISTAEETIVIYDVDYGVSATASVDNNISVISCGGEIKNTTFTKQLSDCYNSIDNIIIPNQKYKYCGYLSSLMNEFDTANVFVYDNDSKTNDDTEFEKSYGKYCFGDNVHFKLNISKTVSDDVFSINGITYQYLKGSNKSLLFIPSEADVKYLPEKYRNADYLLLDSVPKNAKLLSCKTLIFSGNPKQYSENYNDIKELKCEVKNTFKGNVTIKLN